jgi:hypothetical protein
MGGASKGVEAMGAKQNGPGRKIEFKDIYNRRFYFFERFL